MSRRSLLLILACICASCGQGDPVRTLALDTAAGTTAPHLAVGPTGRIVLSYLEPDGTGHALRYRTLEGGRWRQPQTVATGSNWFVNWADFPSVMPLGDSWAAHWLVRSSNSAFAYDIAIATSSDGQTWSAPVVSRINWNGSKGLAGLCSTA